MLTAYSAKRGAGAASHNAARRRCRNGQGRATVNLVLHDPKLRVFSRIFKWAGTDGCPVDCNVDPMYKLDQHRADAHIFAHASVPKTVQGLQPHQMVAVRAMVQGC